jgi:hypothetical protein
MTGLPFAGQYRVKRKGAVLYFAVEGSGTLQTRLTAIAQNRGAPTQLPFAWRSDCPMLTDKRAADTMIGYVTEAAAHFEQTYQMPVTLLWVDTMITAAGFAPGEENDAAATQKALTTLHKIASRTGTLVMAVDHIGKTPEAGTRGSSNKEASVDTVLAPPWPIARPAATSPTPAWPPASNATVSPGSRPRSPRNRSSLGPTKTVTRFPPSSSPGVRENGLSRQPRCRQPLNYCCERLKGSHPRKGSHWCQPLAPGSSKLSG